MWSMLPLQSGTLDRHVSSREIALGITLGVCRSAWIIRPRRGRAHHYVFFNRDRERITEPALLETKASEGAQLKYSRRALENGRDGYEFRDIRHDLEFLTTRGKKLFIQIQDISFGMSIVPIPAIC